MRKQKILQFIFLALCSIFWWNDIFTVKADKIKDKKNQTDSLEYFMTNLNNMTHLIGALAIQSLIAGGEIEADDVIREVVRLPARFDLGKVSTTNWEEVKGKSEEVVKLLKNRSIVDADEEEKVQKIMKNVQETWSPRLLASVKKVRGINMTIWRNGMEDIHGSEWEKWKEGIRKLGRVLEKVNNLEGTKNLERGSYGIRRDSFDVYREARKVFWEVGGMLKQIEEKEEYGQVGKNFKLLKRTFSDAVEQAKHINKLHSDTVLAETASILEKRKTSFDSFYPDLIEICKNLSEFDFLGKVLTSTASPEPERTMMFTRAFIGGKKLKMEEEVKEWLKSHLRKDTNVTDQAVAAIWNFNDFAGRVDEFKVIWMGFTEKLKGVEGLVKVVNEVGRVEKERFKKDMGDVHEFLSNGNSQIDTRELKKKLEECDEDVEKGRRIGEDIRWEVTWIREAMGELRKLLSEEGKDDKEVAIRNDKIKGFHKFEGMLKKSRRLPKKMQMIEELTSGNQKLKELNQHLEAFQSELISADDNFGKIRDMDLNSYRRQSNSHSYMNTASEESLDELLVGLKSVGDSLRAVRTAGNELKFKANGHDEFWKLENPLETAWELHYAQEVMVWMHSYVNLAPRILMDVESVRVLFDSIKKIGKVARRGQKNLISVLEVMKVASRVNPPDWSLSAQDSGWRDYLRNMLGGIRAVETMIKMFRRLNQVKKPNIRIQVKEKPIPIRRIIPFMFPNLLVALFICCVCVYVACFAPDTRIDAELRAYHRRRFYKRPGRSSRRNRTERSRYSNKSDN